MVAEKCWKGNNCHTWEPPEEQPKQPDVEKQSLELGKVETKTTYITENNEDDEKSNVEDGGESVQFFDLKIKAQPKSLKQAWLAAKKLVNLGELSKAMKQFKTIGIAPMTPLIKEEVSKKFEKAHTAPKWPSNKRVREIRKSGRAGIKQEDLKDVIPHEEEDITTKSE